MQQVKLILEKNGVLDNYLSEVLKDYYNKIEINNFKYINSIKMLRGTTDGTIRFYINDDERTMSDDIPVAGLKRLAYLEWVTEDQIWDNAIHERHILNKSIATRHIQDRAVTANNIECPIGSIIGNDKDSKNDKDTPKNDKPEVKDENTGSNSGDNKTPNTGDSGNTSDGNTGSTPATSDDTPSQTTPTTPDTPNTPAPQPAPTIDEVNAALRTQLQNTYGIAIKYGSETSGYNVGGLSTVPISDPNVVNKALNEMASTIALYPSGMWTEMKNSGFPLSIYLITKYSAANVTGVTETYSNKVIISIATNFSFGETFNHEVFHYFENYITYFKGATFGSWSGLNPTNFNKVTS